MRFQAWNKYEVLHAIRTSAWKPVSKNHPNKLVKMASWSNSFWWFFPKKRTSLSLQRCKSRKMADLASSPASISLIFFAAFASRRAIGKWGYSFVNLNYEVPIAESKAQSPWWFCLGCTKLLAFGCSVQDQRHSSHELYQVLKFYGEWDQNYREK